MPRNIIIIIITITIIIDQLISSTYHMMSGWIDKSKALRLDCPDKMLGKGVIVIIIIIIIPKKHLFAVFTPASRSDRFRPDRQIKHFRS